MRVEDRFPLSMRWSLAATLGLFLGIWIAGCRTNGLVNTDGHWIVVPLISRVTNLSGAACRESFAQQLTAALVKQGETAEDAKAMSNDTLVALAYSQSLDRFYSFSPSDLRYGFFVQNRKEGCVLRLYERQKKIFGRKATFQNGIKDYATGRLAGCSCIENELPPDED